MIGPSPIMTIETEEVRVWRILEHGMPGTGEEAWAVRVVGLLIVRRGDAVIGKLVIGLLIPLAAGGVVSGDRGGAAGLILQAEGEVDFDQSPQRLRHVVGRLKVVDNALEAANGGGVEVL